ncbi:hypothetical protein [Paraburkholderia terrae]|uniref:Uncharacterized protein n=2 Tax=Paraburkholderia terrae TaxID=311230 RepID=A0A2I8EQD6_9BURK|nr:hypothetical protein [Paraburkholderia terrae]AUT61817.1 hypothetical protein C2L65_19150 [Paraburkholderia terrae]
MAPVGKRRRLPDLSRRPRRACSTQLTQMVRDHLIGVETGIRDLTRIREALCELSLLRPHGLAHQHATWNPNGHRKSIETT